MKNHASMVLELVLKDAQRHDAKEIRFISGMSPAIVDATGPHFVEVAHLRKETVREIHWECLLVAGRDDLSSLANATYHLETHAIGAFVCTYESIGNVASLKLVPSGGVAEEAELLRPRTPSTLGASAEVGDGK